MWLGSGKHTVKEGMIEIDQERLGIIQSLLGIVMWPRIGKHTFKEGMIEIDQKRLGIIRSLEMGNVAWKLKTHIQRWDDKDSSGKTCYYSVTNGNCKCGLEVENTQSNKG